MTGVIITEQDRLDAKRLHDIIEDEAGSLWYMGHNGHLSVIDVHVDLARVVARFRGEKP
jgi:hypothetical protein